ncbi:ABC transporter transmembrane domain-containing protein [Streptomyces sp. NPDC093085]|uniref:ABC transporter transmembrane domain-containing protein n=1 Tax=Streptomyces sp. NPDC093085 TaxID=3155068 RepID=UPI00341CFCB3
MTDTTAPTDATAPAAPTTAADDDTPAAAPGPPAGAATPSGRAARRSTVRSLLRLWPYVRPVRRRFFTAAVVATVASSLGLVMPLVLKWLVDGPVRDRDPGGVWLGALVLLALGVAEALLFGLRRWLVARPLAGVEAAMRADLYRHLQRLPVAFHDRWPSGQLLSRGTTDLMLLRLFLAFPLTFLVVNGATVVVGAVILLLQEWSLGLVLLLPVIPLVLLLSVFEARYSLVTREAQDQVGDVTTVVEESVLGIRIVKGFGRHRSQAEAFRALTRRLRATELHKVRLLAAIWAVIMSVPELAIGAALVLGTVQVADGALSAGTLVAFLSTALALRWPVESIGFLLAMSQDAAAATDRFFEVMDVREERDPDPAPGTGTGTAPTPAPGKGNTGRGPAPASSSAPDPGPGRDPAAGGEASPPPDPGGLRFEGVSFRYPDAAPEAPPVLDRIDLHIAPGETMALVGATGSGKTTLTALVPRLHEVTAGRITLDGEDIAHLPRERVREMVSVAFEEPTLFSATIGENVLMGAAGAGPGAVRRALDVAQVDFVAGLPGGVDTEVGEQGHRLSGGQRQRLALARAVAGRPRFLVLDDPLSALDVHTEARVEAALRRVLRETTALVVAHRPSTVLLADRVALLSGGRIAAVGTHQELLRSSTEYAWLMTGAETHGAGGHGAGEHGAGEHGAGGPGTGGPGTGGPGTEARGTAAPVDAEPVGPEPADAEPVGTKPLGAERADAEPMAAEPVEEGAR